MFNLNEFIREMMDTTDECDPLELSYLIFGKIAAEDQPEALLQALPTVVSQLQVKDRGRTLTPSPTEASLVTTASAPKKRRSRVPAGPSHWESKIVNNYNPKLYRVYVGANGIRKKLGDFTAADFRDMIDSYKIRIERETKFVERCEAVADYMETQGTSVAWDAPEELTAAL